MRVLLCAINAKYIHSNLAVHYLREYARFSFDAHESMEVRSRNIGKIQEIEIEEYTINQHFDEVLKDIYIRRPDLIGFSCYIWNISFVERLIVELKKILPKTKLWLGGPEVSYNAIEIMEKFPQLSGIVKGEGEEAFISLLKVESYKQSCKESYEESRKESCKKGCGEVKEKYKEGYGVVKESCLEEIPGIAYRDERGGIKETPICNQIDLDSLPFPYENLSSFKNRIIYYESSRGCPYSCTYCLSSANHHLRFKSWSNVEEELMVLINNNVGQVKFVDRTFNCDRKRARKIWQFIHEHDNGEINFHFEIAGDLLEEEDFKLLSTFRQGLVQFEIGVQSTNPLTLKEINRVMDFSLLGKAVTRLKESQNIHLHLDLIAGLPMENMESFIESFNQVYQLRAEHLQLGFLKLLKGSLLDKDKETYGLMVQEHPPYEVLATKCLDFNEILRIKAVEEMVEIYYNSGQFLHSMIWLEKKFFSPFCFYESLGDFYSLNGYKTHHHSREKRYEMLLEFAKREGLGDDKRRKEIEEFRQLLTLDYYLRENPKKRPAFAGEEMLSKEAVKSFYDKESVEFNYLTDYRRMEKRKIRKMTHLESINGKVYLFDYLGRNSWNPQARTHIVSIESFKS